MQRNGQTLSLLVGVYMAFPSGLAVKNLPCNAGGLGLIPGSGREHDSPLQYSCLENPMDRGSWRAAVHRVTQSQTRLRWLGTHTHRSNIHVWRCPAPPCFFQGVELPSIHLVAEAKTLGPSWTLNFPHCLQIQPVIRPFTSTSEANFHVPSTPDHLHWACLHETNAGPSYQARRGPVPPPAFSTVLEPSHWGKKIF